ncbi:hypothetical protein ACISNM_01405, partial [Campylobacter jejuni]
KNLYIFEKTVYLIKNNRKLDKTRVFKLSESVDKISFIGNSKCYYVNKILNFL